ncbi:MAG: glycosyl hydrolase, partial [Saprospiraceae bacterium]
SEHIGKIIVDPTNSDIVYVAAIGPVWSAGGDRGVYKTVDGGKTWEAVLTVDEHTGVNDLVMDPRDPEVLYASAFQRERKVFTYIGGGPGSGIYKTVDGGKTWEKANKGLPGVDKGRIGLAISPANPEIIYAIVEAAEGKGGVFASTNRGASWQKRSGYNTSGNYYQEIVADPIDENTLYAMDTWMQISTDGGRSFNNVGEDFKHVDNHALWIDPEDTDHLLAGCDGGVYESFDRGKNWDFKANLPVTQFYKVALDNAEPFYNVYGGTQDNFSMGGPSRTVSGNGISNEQWFMTNGGDGFESQVDPNNPDIVYAQSQYGGLVRYDHKSGEILGIQPKERKDENAYRWNWDAPLVISKHLPTRIYFAANKVFRSDDRGNSWEVISEDLTQQINRNELKVMGRVWGIDAVAKNVSTSPYGTIVALDESPMDPNMVYAGTDDGLIQITTDGGKSWMKASQPAGVPANTYVNMVLGSQHDKQVIYACYNHHKEGDFKPYVYKSTDLGKTWTSITANLPERGSSYAIAEDFVDPDLLFVGTEFGVYFSNNGGQSWKALKAGLPTIAIRDIAIQRRETDLVLASFGRGFYVLDDYSALRHAKEADLMADATIYPVRPALQYEPSYPLGLPKKGFQGDNYYLGENLGPVAMITYFVKEKIESLKDQRQAEEKKAAKDGKDNLYPSYEALKAEQDQPDAYLLFTITGADGNIVRKLTTNPGTGVQRILWDLRYAAKDPVSLGGSGFYNPFAGPDQGRLVDPGRYQVTLSKSENGVITPLAGPVEIEVKALNNTTLPATDREALVAFQGEVADLARVVQGAQRTMGSVQNKMRLMKEAIKATETNQEDLMKSWLDLDQQLVNLRTEIFGDPIASRLDIDTPPSITNRLYSVVYEAGASTAAPTKTHRDSYALAKEEFVPWYAKLKALISGPLAQLQQKLIDAGAPYTPDAMLELLKK